MICSGLFGCNRYLRIVINSDFGLRLAILVMIYLGWLVEAHLHIYDRLVCLSQPLPDNPDFLSHRLLGGLTEATNTCFWLHRGLLRKSLS